jgi:diguanylate cyclase (GGDEF)-like protein
MPGAETEECRTLADQLRRAVEKTLGDSVNVTISLGVSASARGEMFDYDSVFASADAALYEAKQKGRNTVHSEPVAAGDAIEPVPEPFTAAFAD